MATIVTRSGKGSPLTHTEVDSNFSNLNNDKQEILTEGAFVDGDKSKLDGIEALADVTDTANVTAAGALMDSEVTNLAAVKAFDPTDYATAAQGALAASALQDGDTVSSLTITSADINGGTIDGVTIGGSSAGAITGTTITGTSFVASGDMTFGDNDKAIFGAGSDLQIYHDGSQSYIKDSGVGSLRIEAEDFQVRNADGSKVFIYADAPSGGTLLYHNGSEKLATTSTGIDVTGTVTADRLDIDFGTANSAAAIIDHTDTANGNGVLITAGGSNSGKYVLNARDGSGNNKLYVDANGDISFYEDTGTTAKFFWDASAESLGIGTSSPSGTLTVYKDIDSVTVPTAKSDYSIVVDVNGNVSDSYVGGIAFGDSAVSTTQAAILAVDAGGSAATHLAFATGSTGGIAERMRIDSSGNLLVGKTNTTLTNAGFVVYSYGRIDATVNGSTPVRVNREGNDGYLIDFLQAGTSEGQISISGSTVSYVGGHLARWSQLPDDSKDESIVKGTVMTNLDAMCEWSHADEYWTEEDELPVDEEGNPTAAVGDLKKAAFTEDNEQLNRMAVSSVEGDPNVAGVFVNWDNDDDEFNDMNIAMTGDMVIRIAQGTTVQRGDLLMSAGDGTAKPQGDDIVRSKTIAKVTSTHVSHTYDDGSYLVPCVLMAC